MEGAHAPNYYLFYPLSSRVNQIGETIHGELKRMEGVPLPRKPFGPVLMHGKSFQDLLTYATAPRIITAATAHPATI
ncbi:MAG: hypothetical protein IJ592_03680, partial [Candidatus Methanomethylophilaceae archaeon]|nr:hypothetical protein [Candidatus Methanomethylophilaceae archaeon]